MRWLGEIAMILAKALQRTAYVAAIVLLVVVEAIVALVTESTIALVALVATILVAVLGMFFLELKDQKRQLRRRGPNLETPEIPLHGDTIALAKELDPSDKVLMADAVKRAAKASAAVLEVPEALVRANVFGLGPDGVLRQIPEFGYHMDRKEELTVKMVVGEGSSGRAFSTRRPNIALFEKDWGSNAIADEELRKVHPDLRWIVSMPVLFGSPARPVWVLNVDGIEEAQDTEALTKVVQQLYQWSRIISLVLQEALGEEVDADAS